MSFLLIQLAAPAAEPITLADARAYLRLDDTGEDALVGELIAAARSYVERATGRSLMRQDWRMETDVSSDHAVPLLRGPVSEILAVSTLDDQGQAIQLPSTSYALSVAGNELCLHASLTAARLRIDYRCGMVQAGDVPPPLRHAVRSAVLSLYESRDGGGAVDAVIAPLVASYRLLSI